MGCQVKLTLTEVPKTEDDAPARRFWRGVNYHPGKRHEMLKRLWLPLVLLLIAIVGYGSWRIVKREAEKRAVIEKLERYGTVVNQTAAPRWLSRPIGREWAIRLFPRPYHATLYGFVNNEYLVADDAALDLLGKVPSMKIISLMGPNEVTDDGIKQLAHLPDLVTLHLYRANLTDRSAAYIGTMKQLQRLTFFDVAITDDGLEHLKHLTSLAYFGISSTRTTSSGIAELQKALPNCRIDTTWQTAASGL